MANLPVGLLLRARVAAELSHLVYDIDKVRLDLKSGFSRLIETDFKPLKLNTFSAVALYFTPRKARIQYAIWEVARLGLVVAFRGTCKIIDVTTDANILSQIVHNSTWRAHKGILTAVESKGVYAEILKQYSRWCGRSGNNRLPLILTGHSLGGGYALAFALRLLAEPPVQPQIQLRVFTFGAPLVLADRSVHENLANACQKNEGVKIHNFVSLYDMVPRLLGRFVPETVRPHLFYVNPEVSHAALNFTPFGHFHLLSQNQMLSTMMDSRGGYADNHALQMSQQYQEALGPLIAQHSLEGVLLLSHAMGGYITEVKGVLSSDVSCGSKQASRLYQATLCHTGGESVAQQGWLSEDATLAWTHVPSGLVLSSAPRESAVEDITSKKLKSGLAESMLAYAQYKAARIFDPMGYQALQVGLQTLGQTTHILHTVHTIEMAADKTQQQLLSVSQQVQQEGALTRQTLTNLFKTQGDQIGQAFNDQLNMLKLIQSEQQSQTAHFDSTAQAILQLIAQSNRDLQHAFAERDRKKLEVALGMVHQFLRNVREDVQEQRGSQSIRTLATNSAISLEHESMLLWGYAKVQLNDCSMCQPKLSQEQKTLLLWQRHNLVMALATSSIGIDSAVFVLRNRRMGHSEAIDYLKNEIVMLLQHATLYSLSVMLRLVLQRYVFMLNSLTVPALPACLCTRADDLPQLPAGTAIKHASPGCFGHLTKANNQVDSSDKAPALPATVQLVHDISTLQPWHDGLEPLQSLLAPPLSEDAIDSIPATAMPDSLPIQSFEDWEWYMNLVQLPRSADMQKQGPPSHISVSSLLEVLGVGPTTMPQIQQHLRREHEALLREAVLPRFIDTLISCIDKQIPGIDLRAQHAKTPFLRGTASGSCTPGRFGLVPLHRDDSFTEASAQLRDRMAASGKAIADELEASCREAQAQVQELTTVQQDLHVQLHESQQAVARYQRSNHNLQADLIKSEEKCRAGKQQTASVTEEYEKLKHKWEHRGFLAKLLH